MKRTAILGSVLALALATAAPPATAKEMTDAEKALAALVALGIGVAVAKHGKNHDSTSTWDEDLYGEPFSPARDVVCLPRPRKCYEDGHLSWRWTQRIFG